MTDELSIALYVLGVLDRGERAQVDELLQQSPQAREQRDQWERRLAPLQNRVPEVSPPPGLWHRIQQQLGLIQPKPARRTWRLPGLAGAALSAVILAGLWLFVPTTPEVQPTQREELAFVVNQDTYWTASWSAQQPQTLRLTAVDPSGVGTDQDHQVWLLHPEREQPQAIALMPRQPGQSIEVSWPGPMDNASIAVSREPRGGSRQQGPSGPIVVVVPVQRG
nr:anti-sigma factor [Oceanococcus sp. HetDA_MAG_MS8]